MFIGCLDRIVMDLGKLCGSRKRKNFGYGVNLHPYVAIGRYLRSFDFPGRWLSAGCDDLLGGTACGVPP